MSSALAVAALLLAACGSDSPPSSSLTQVPNGNGSNGSVTVPTGCTLPDAQRSALPDFAADPSGTKVQWLGVNTVGEEIPFTIPPGTVSFTIVEQAVNAPLSVSLPDGGSTLTVANKAVPFNVVDPNGIEVFNDASSFSLPHDLSQVTSSVVSAPLLADGGTGTLTAPNTSAGLKLLAPGGNGFPSGGWSLTVSDWAYECATNSALGCSGSGSKSSTYDVNVITKTADLHAVPSAGTIDLAIYFATSSASGSSLTADKATSGQDADLNRMVSTLSGIYAKAGITISGPTYYDLPEVQDAYAAGVDVDQAGACSQLAQLLEHSKPGNTLNIFFVSRFVSTQVAPGRTVVGIDGTIPGPSSVGGTVASGAAVSAADLRFRVDASSCAGAPDYEACGADQTAYYIAHEAGHFLGLYHTTEALGFDFDALESTATCSCSTCATRAVGEVCSPTPTSSSHLMDSSDCTPTATKPDCGGADNLMFWSLDVGAAGRIVPEQAQVMLANPLVQ